MSLMLALLLFFSPPFLYFIIYIFFPYKRMPMHGRWWVNDPDCMLLRDTTAFTAQEIIGMVIVEVLLIVVRP